MVKRKVLITEAKDSIASQMLPQFRELYVLTLINVKDSDPSGGKVSGATIEYLTDSDLEPYRTHFQYGDTIISPDLGFPPHMSRSRGFS